MKVLDDKVMWREVLNPKVIDWLIWTTTSSFKTYFSRWIRIMFYEKTKEVEKIKVWYISVQFTKQHRIN